MTLVSVILDALSALAVLVLGLVGDSGTRGWDAVLMTLSLLTLATVGTWRSSLTQGTVNGAWATATVLSVALIAGLVLRPAWWGF
jgi:hypothetical protein